MSAGRRIAIVSATLQGGGSERVVSMMANHWAQNGIAVSVLTIDDPRNDFYSLDPSVRRFSAGLSPPKTWRDSVHQATKRLRFMRASMRQANADIAIGFIDKTNIQLLAATRGLKIPVIISERTDPRFAPLPWHWRFARRVTYRLASAVVVQTRAVAEWANTLVATSRVRVIRNPVRLNQSDRAHAKARSERTFNRPHIVAIGRLAPEKGFNYLLEAFARVVELRPGCLLTILGEGPERAALTKQSAELGLSDHVTMPGLVLDPNVYLADADVFALSSLVEGFPNALLEAMAMGVPVVATDCPSGPREIIEEGTNGILVPPAAVDAMAEAILTLLGDADLRMSIGIRAAHSAEAYSTDRIMAQWDELIDAILIAERD